MKDENIVEVMTTVTLTNAAGKQIWPPQIDLAQFDAASKAAESWVDAIAEARHFIEIGEPKATLGALIEARLSHEQYSKLIQEALPYLNAIGDGTPIRYHGSNRVTEYATAHEAIADRILLLTNVLEFGSFHDPDPIRRSQAAADYFNFQHPEVLEIDASRLKVCLQRERAKLIQICVQAEQRNAAKQVASESTNAATVVEQLMDESAPEIIAIVRSKKSSDEKMRAICELDKRWLGKDSPDWAKLLDVSEGAIRKTKFWKKDRHREIGGD
jgi:hypothetical protein